MIRLCLRSALFMLGAAQLLVLPAVPARAAITEQEAFEIGVDAYTYAYPLVLTEITRRVSVGPAGSVPMNEFKHRASFPDARFKNVVRPNADTLYSSLWFDVSEEPLMLSLPDTGGRYYVLPLMDMWTDVFATFGSRTTGTAAGSFVLVGPNWKGSLPEGTRVVRSPTAFGWILGRIQANGVADFPNVHRMQAGLKVRSLSGTHKPVAAEADGGVDRKTPPVTQIANLEPGVFFALFAELMKANPPHAADYPALFRIERLGLVPGKEFSLAAAAPEVRQGLTRAVPVALKRITEARRKRTPRDGWTTATASIGVYGTDYLIRAFTAYAGLGALPPEDAIYPAAVADSEGRPLSGEHKYVLRFDKGQVPPADAFWSLTMYGADQFFVDNPINRYAIGDRDPLVLAADGSLEIYIQRESPGKEKEANWLPAAAGAFTMNLRLYLPRAEAVDGRWAPPGVKRLP